MKTAGRGQGDEGKAVGWRVCSHNQPPTHSLCLSLPGAVALTHSRIDSDGLVERKSLSHCNEEEAENEKSLHEERRGLAFCGS